ncbi:FAD-dependent oxidoreductase [Rhodococcus sp. IEGM 1401]|uniref:NAD(P)/FAD-dependent oxidoreductase n=1 Tax=unclassified Rhodococcus (in: high G+C Gram-positive bacteria) TaxID=192944 RepID=UPI0022B427DE|nr:MULTISPECIES: FAD-dependent oxidoreductase [unclassified Rhodococcus (in: high G+C Gram-positive bacteria)]MCZ4562684.1 FAD-dependent oxidoreductase [Rhodococcus sp. IEGM 1401]MDI9922803.1 FAD-dependent oxidoreductase [Rhodococcus sp. IEGM 1372]MDV8035351.1 FAD-dependent oxidoreductase [Rhodococcus sp. IEGM 1414]MDV8079033.1 FAD-dependent oxidoreductase [Rhodococcus sp. IEGM 1370]
MKSVTVVGASLAGVAAARALRDQGFDGRITMIGDEVHQPYDRPPLSKAFLLGDESAVSLDVDDLDLDWRLGCAATGLSGTTVSTVSGDVTADAVVIATGASAIRLPGTIGVDGIHVLRSLDDALALRSSLVPGVRVTVVGAGFIGSEVASTALRLGASVTVVEASKTPLARVFGGELGSLIAGWHRNAGAALLTGVSVAGFVVAAGRVRAVELADGSTIESDVVVLGVGSVPNVGWLDGSELEICGGVVTDQRGITSNPAVLAVGDCAAVRDAAGVIRRDEHWTSAATRPAVAVEALLTGGSKTFTGLPYVWSDQYAARIQFAGHHGPHCVAEIVEGDPATGPFVALYRHDNHPVAVLAVSSPRSFGKWRRQVVDTANPTA